MTKPGKLGVSRLGRRVKRPYFYALDGATLYTLARLLVDEDEFWARLGKALGIKIVTSSWPGCPEYCPDCAHPEGQCHEIP